MSDPGKAVFLSYASQDADAAKRICESLRQAGVEVWFDQSEPLGRLGALSLSNGLRGGDAWDAKIRQQIKECALFVPVRSAFSRNQRPISASGLLSRFDQDFPVKIVMEAEMMPLDQLVEQRLQRGHVAMGFRSQQYSKCAGQRHPYRSGNTAATRSAFRREPTAPELPVVEKSVVVLPFENLSTDPENAIFTEGMHLETIDVLSQLGDLKVISRPSSVALKGSTLSLAEIGRKLDVAHAIVGSVRPEGNRVRVRLELRRAADEAVLWSKTFNEDWKAASEIQTQIATEVARVLQARDQRGTHGGAKFLTENPRAYELFIKLRQEYDNAGTLPKGFLERVEQLVQLDSDFMPAVNLLATLYIRVKLLPRGVPGRLAAKAEAKRWAERASSLMPGGAGDGALAYYHYIAERDYETAVKFADRVIRALPNDALGHNYRAIALMNARRSTEALESAQRAVSLDPLNALFQDNRLRLLALMRRAREVEAALVQWRNAFGEKEPIRLAELRWILEGAVPVEADEKSAWHRWLWRARRHEELAAWLERRLDDTTLTIWARCGLMDLKAMNLRRLGQDEKAKVIGRQFLEVATRLPEEDSVHREDKLVQLARARLLAGETDIALRMLERFLGDPRSANTRLEPDVILAETYAEAGRAAECVALLKQLLVVVTSRLSIPVLQADPAWDNVRDDAAFKALLIDPKNRAPL